MKTFICVDKDGWTGGLQLSIEHDGGSGFRLAGPKYNGSSKRLLSHEITEYEADEIRTYLDEITTTQPPAPKPDPRLT